MPDESVYEDDPCPVCGELLVESSFACPGYPSGYPSRVATWVCQPACGDAWEFRCRSPGCGWWFRDPNNRQDREQMGVEPSWLVGHWTRHSLDIDWGD